MRKQMNGRPKIRLITGLIFLLLMGNAPVFAQLVAFPGAEGAGQFATGGRGTATTASTVFEVTNLSDDGLAGSLGLMSTLIFGFYFLNIGQLPYAILAFSLAGSLSAFLIFNFPYDCMPM